MPGIILTARCRIFEPTYRIVRAQFDVEQHKEQYGEYIVTNLLRERGWLEDAGSIGLSLNAKETDMPIGILFWAIFLILIIFGGLWWRNGQTWAYGYPGSYGIVMVLIFLLGWAEFGFILQGGRGSPFH